MKSLTTDKRAAVCGEPMGEWAVMVDGEDDVFHYANNSTCGKLWLCPVCSAKVRAKRAEDIALALARHFEAGGGAYFLAMTLPHGRGDALARTVQLVNRGLAEVMKGGAWRRQRERIGYVGHIRALEVTHGVHGWHPHLHPLVLTEKPLTEDEMRHELHDLWKERWDAHLQAEGWPSTVDEGVQVQAVKPGSTALASYLAKVQEAKVGNEMARGDLKSARRVGSRVPFELLANIGTTGDITHDRGLWLEYEAAMQRVPAIRWSKGLRARLLPDVEELTDEEAAAEEVGGVARVFIHRDTMRALERVPGGQADALSAMERGGFDELSRFLVALGIGTNGIKRAEDMQGRGRAPDD